MKPMLRHFFVIVLFVCSYPSPANSGEFLISLPESLQSNGTRTSIEAIFNRIYQTIDITPTYVYLPTQRGIQLMESGKIDAEGVRTHSVGKAYTKAIRIPKAFITLEVVTICLEKQHCILNEDTAVGVLKTFEAAKAYCVDNQLNCTQAQKVDDLFKLLETGFADAVIMITHSAALHVCQLNSQQINYALMEDLGVDAFHYLHQKHQKYAPSINHALTSPEVQHSIAQLKSLWVETTKQCGKTILPI